ncbi:MAG: DUF5685 family protein [Oscillospiraceae bacterium]|nr:DUF5685 family protein [Oscillospiraceae bacterium]
MLGYVRIGRPRLTEEQFRRYQGVYCSLCRVLGREYGLLARMTLSYDFTFLAMLRMALDPEVPGSSVMRCPYRPMKTFDCCAGSRHIRYAAAMSALLTRHKLRDQLADGGFWKRIAAKCLLLFSKRGYRKAKKQYPEAAEQIEHWIARQSALEAAQTASLDAAAEPTAAILAGMLSYESKAEQRPALERLGYCLGRWIYLTDAADDLEEDLKQGSYNPFILTRNIQKNDPDKINAVRKDCEQSLNACLAECETAYYLLDRHRFDDILKHILTEGMPAAQKYVLKWRVVSGE